MESPLALYRRYRPETFAEVIGQDHVTEPLRAALANNRVNHAYLFSGPRGCGKTTSARILARALNCAQAPVADPCGECDSCRDLARGGPGSIDVIEIDAASHGGVDDARDLREKAFFAPVRSRYKVYIIDEAHMVTTQGFNALLKLVEEPPPHLRFIFATTEPDKVLPTIRSRTHHYPFRLIPPRLLSSYLSELCQKEGVAIEPAALPLVVRAGAGSARDTLSVLDQLLGGAGPDGVTHALATGLLGYTPDTLLDEVVDAFAAGDGAAVFGVVDKVIETGQDPRRFTEDLLRRLRDLVIVAAVPDAPGHRADRRLRGPGRAAGRPGRPLRPRRAQPGRRPGRHRAHRDARGDRAAAAARADLRPGAAARAPTTRTDGVMARLDRLEQRVVDHRQPLRAAAPVARPRRPRPTAPPGLGAGAQRRGAAHAPSPPAPARRPPPRRPAAGPAAAAARAATGTARARGARASEPAPAAQPPAPAAPPTRRARSPGSAAPAPGAPPPRQPRLRPAAAAPAAAGGLSLVDVRRLWPDIVEATKMRRRLAWMHLTQNAQVVDVDGTRPHPRVHQRRRPRLLRQRRLRRDPPPGRHRRGRRRLAHRDDRRPGRRSPASGHAPAVPPEAAADRAARRRRPEPPAARAARAARPPRTVRRPGWHDPTPRARRPRAAPASRHPRRRRAGAAAGRTRAPTPAPSPRRAGRSSRPARRAAPRPTPRAEDLPPPTPRRTPTTSTPSTSGLDTASCSRRELGAQVIEEIRQP